MRSLWVHRVIDARPDIVWQLLTDPEAWSSWGPTVARATIDGNSMQLGSTGTVTTIGGLRLPFEITAYEEGARWSWKVSGVPATDHTLSLLDPDRCRVGFGVPWPAAAYLVVCGLGLRRLEDVAQHRLEIDEDS